MNAVHVSKEMWILLLGTVFHLNCVLPQDLSSSFYKLLKTFLFPGSGLGVHLSNYLEVALHKFPV